jgi:hypothetical protein
VTIREHIRRKKRRSAILLYSGFALFGLGGFIAAQTQNPAFLAITFIGFAMFGGGMLYQSYGIRCPSCGGAIGLTLAYSNPFSLPAGYSFCPYCGKSLDTDTDASQQA